MKYTNLVESVILFIANKFLHSLFVRDADCSETCWVGKCTGFVNDLG